MENPNTYHEQNFTIQSNPNDLNELGFRIPFGRRFGASFVDFFLYMFVLILAVIMSGLSDIMSNYPLEKLQDPEFMASIPEIAKMQYWVTIANYLCIGVLLMPQALWGVTLGKLLFKLKIANEDRTEADLKTLFTRFSIKHAWVYFLLLGNLTGITIFGILQLVFMIVLIVECLVATGMKAQAGHDILAKTAVFHKDDILPLQQHNFA